MSDKPTTGDPSEHEFCFDVCQKCGISAFNLDDNEACMVSNPTTRTRERDSCKEVKKCHDCARPYGDENGFPDLIIPFWAWKRISSTRDDGGLLCPSCICKRLHDRGIKCEGAFMSGPIISVSQVTMSNLRRVENTELNTETSSSTQEDRRPVVKMWIVEYEENGCCWRTVVEHYTREEAMSYFEQEWPNIRIRECY